MKKILLATILFVMVAVFATTMVNAATGAELPNLIYEKGSKYGVTESHKIKMERYLAKHPATDAQADAVMANMAKLSAADLKKVQDLATEAAAILNVKIAWDGAKVTIYYEGRVEDVIEFSDKLPYTGNDTSIALVVSSVAVVALAAGFIARKKFANA